MRVPPRELGQQTLAHAIRSRSFPHKIRVGISVTSIVTSRVGMPCICAKSMRVVPLQPSKERTDVDEDVWHWLAGLHVNDTNVHQLLNRVRISDLTGVAQVQ